MRMCVSICFLWLFLACGRTGERSGWPAHFGFGRTARADEIARWNISVGPDGRGLPLGSGTVTEGRGIYLEKCASCHGATGVEGQVRLVGAMGDTGKVKTIGNYWPYATTLYDYVRRAMPYNAPGSLTSHEVYGLTAYLLWANKIIDSGVVMDAGSLPKVEMPARKYFVKDDRRGGPEVR